MRETQYDARGNEVSRKDTRTVEQVRADITADTKALGFKILARTDWMVIRALEHPLRPMPIATRAARDAVRQAVDDIEAEVATLDFEALLAHDWRKRMKDLGA